MIRISGWKRILLIGLLLALLPGCSGLPGGIGAEPVTLHFVYIEGTADYAPLAEEFHRQHSNITIELDKITPSGDTMNTLTSKLPEADVVRVPSLAISNDLTSQFLPLDTQITTDRNFPVSDMFPGSMEALKVDGRQMGVPAGLDPFVVFYSPSKLTVAGLQVPDPAWTLKDFVQAASALQDVTDANKASGQFTYGFCSYPASTDPAIFTYLFGGGLFDSLTQVGLPTLNRRENVDAVAWYASLKTDFGLIPPANNQRELGAMIYRQNCGFWIDWLSRSTYGYGRNGGQGDAVAMLPLPSQTVPFNIVSVDSYAIVSASKNPDQAWQWLSFLVSQPVASGNLVPPLKAEALTKTNSARLSPEILTLATHLPQNTVVLGASIYTNERFGKVLELFAQAVTQVTDGNSDAQSALDMAQKSADQLFK